MKTLLFIVGLFLTGCGCMLSQVPPVVTVQAGPGCQAPLPDLRIIAVASYNCNGPITKQQIPEAGLMLTIANPAVTVTLTATDAFGNVSKPLIVSVILTDTVKPILSWPQGQANMTDQDLVNLYKNWEAAVKVNGIAKWMYDRAWTQGLPFADSTRMEESLRYFTNIIKLSEEEYNQYVNYRTGK